MGKSNPTDAPGILKDAAETIENRASQRDDAQAGERSMAATVDAFNALYGTELSETQGWMFMVLLKAARARQGQHNMDDYIDGAAYFALAGESATVEQFTASLDQALDLAVDHGAMSHTQRATFLADYIPEV